MGKKKKAVVIEREWHLWHPIFSWMSLSWIWIAEYCRYLCPSANSIFDSLIPRAFVKQKYRYQEQNYSQPPSHYGGINGNTYNTQQWKGQWVEGKNGVQLRFSQFIHCLLVYMLAELLLPVSYKISEGNLIFQILSKIMGMNPWSYVIIVFVGAQRWTYKYINKYIQR